MSMPIIFSDSARQSRMRRAEHAKADDRWIIARMADELAIRLSAVTRPVEDVLLIGLGSDLLASAPILSGKALTILSPASPVPFREDRLDEGAGRFDVVIACGTFDSVNDLPGALVLARRALKPGGVFLAAMAGAGSLPMLRQAVASAQAMPGLPGVARFHPAIDVRAAGDLLSRVGFKLPVADSETVPVTYRSIRQYWADLRGAAMTACLADSHPLSRVEYQSLMAAIEAGRDPDGRICEELALLYLTGWSPDAA